MSPLYSYDIMHAVIFRSLSLCTVNCSPTGQVAFCISFDFFELFIFQFISLNSIMYMVESVKMQGMCFFLVEDYWTSPAHTNHDSLVHH